MVQINYVDRSNIPPPVVPTPWRKVMLRFNISLCRMAKLMNRERSSLSRAINGTGMIAPYYQKRLIKVARENGIDLRPEDLLPDFNLDQNSRN